MTSETNSPKVEELVTRAIGDALLIGPEKIVPSARLISDLEAESIDIVDIRFRIEEGIGLKIDQRTMANSLGKDLTPEKFDNLFTVQFIIDYVKMLLSQRK